MALYHKWDVKNGSAYVLQFFSLISEGLGGVFSNPSLTDKRRKQTSIGWFCAIKETQRVVHTYNPFTSVGF